MKKVLSILMITLVFLLVSCINNNGEVDSYLDNFLEVHNGIETTSDELYELYYESNEKAILMYKGEGSRYFVEVLNQGDGTYELIKHDEMIIDYHKKFSPIKSVYSVELNSLYLYEYEYNGVNVFDFNSNEKDVLSVNILIGITENYISSHYQEEYTVTNLEQTTELLRLENLHNVYYVHNVGKTDPSKIIYFSRNNTQDGICTVFMYNYATLVDSLEIEGECGKLVSRTDTDFVIEITDKYGSDQELTIPQYVSEE